MIIAQERKITDYALIEYSIKLQHTSCPYGSMMLIDERMAFVVLQALDTQLLNDNREMGVFDCLSPGSQEVEVDVFT